MSKKQGKKDNIEPKEIFGFLVVLNLLLFALILLIPSGKISLFKNVDFVFVPKEKLWENTKPISKEEQLESIIQKIENQVADTQKNADTILYKLPIMHPDSGKNALLSFYQTLIQLRSKKNKVYRILHIGDSQLEGDRITDYLREKMQNRFGGKGPGIINPLEPTAYYRKSVLLKQSKNWHKEAIYVKNSKNKKGAYGIGGASFIYSNYNKIIGYDTTIYKVDSLFADSLQIDTMSQHGTVEDTTIVPIYKNQVFQKAWIKAKTLQSSFPKAKNFEQIQLIYMAQDSTYFSFSENNRKGFWLTPCLYPKKVQIPLFSDKKNISIYFQGPNMRLFSMSLDGLKGIAVDNFPMRGSSGLGFETINRTWLSNQLKMMEVKLLILQFGINVVPNPQKNYNYYQRMFSAQLKAIKKAHNDLSILVIGPSDMSRKKMGVYESYPNIPLIRDAMKRAAFENGCAFWDLYENMGGQNAMLSWVKRKPPLAAKDYTHFNPEGARYIGEMLFNALINDFKNYEKTIYNSNRP